MKLKISKFKSWVNDISGRMQFPMFQSSKLLNKCLIRRLTNHKCSKQVSNHVLECVILRYDVRRVIIVVLKITSKS